MERANPGLSAEDKRKQRERDQLLIKERLASDAEKALRKKRMFGVSLLTGPGGERGVGARLGAGI